MAGNNAAVKFVDLRKGFTNLPRVSTQEIAHEDLNLEEQGGSGKDTDLLVKVEMNPKQDKFITPENEDSLRRYIKWLSVSVGILFLMCLASIIASMVKIHEQKHETLQKTLEMGETAHFQMNISKGNENKLEEVNQNQTKRNQNLLSRIQGIEVLLHAAFANQSNQERKLSSISLEMQEISEIPFRKGCDDANPPFTNIEEGNGTVFRILPSIAGGVWAYCQNIDGQLWTVFQRRQDGSVDFSGNWNDYVRGFGDPLGEFWLGLEAIHQLTNTGQYQLRIDMEDMNGTRWYAAYSSFSVGSGSEYYPLRVSGYSGNASDALRVHNNYKFSTKDKDNDAHSSGHCALGYRSGWWFSDCFDSNLNGLYGARNVRGVVWHHRNKDGSSRRMNMRFTEMKLIQKQ